MSENIVDTPKISKWKPRAKKLALVGACSVLVLLMAPLWVMLSKSNILEDYRVLFFIGRLILYYLAWIYIRSKLQSNTDTKTLNKAKWLLIKFAAVYEFLFGLKLIQFIIEALTW